MLYVVLIAINDVFSMQNVVLIAIKKVLSM